MGFFNEITTLDEVPQFEVEKVALRDVNGNSIPKAYSLQRVDNSQHLGIVKEGYRPIQIEEMLNVIKDASTVIGDIEHTGFAESKGGRKMVVRSRLLHDIDMDGDVIQPHFYTVIDNTGMGSNKTLPSTIRVTCDNAMHIISKDQSLGKLDGVRHAATFEEKIETMVNQIKSNVSNTIRFASDARKLRGQKFDRNQMTKLVQTLIPVEEEESVKRQTKRDKIVGLFFNGRGNSGESKWDALNAITEFETHSGKQSTEKFIRSFSKNTLSARTHKLLLA
jgi:hypothetical protein|tara:strand:- start:1977 stop:2810 length:834 start_codon:yes stop_codon:yes gene_type:complete